MPIYANDCWNEEIKEDIIKEINNHLYLFLFKEGISPSLRGDYQRPAARDSLNRFFRIQPAFCRLSKKEKSAG